MAHDLGAVRDNEWHRVDLVDDVDPPLVSVIIPAFECQESLDRLLASLAVQDHPADRLEIVVVDDGSSPPLRIPEGVESVVRERAESFGAGRARNAGAAVAEGDLLVFLDADMLVGADTISTLARWHVSHPAAVLTGIIRFFDVHALADGELDRAIAERALPALLAEVASNDQEWRDKHFTRTRDLTVDEAAIFRVSVGAVMAVPAALHRAVGGLRELGIRGIEDTEYGYRLHNAGALLVLERRLGLWHQGRRFFDSSRADAAKQQRELLNTELMAVEPYRADGSVPRAVAVAVVTTEHGATVTGLERSRRRDVFVEEGVEAAADGPAAIDRDAIPHRITVLRSCRFSPETIDKILDEMHARDVGVLHVVEGGGAELVRIVRRRAEGRAALVGLEGAEAAAHAAEAFGERWVPASDLEIDAGSP